MSDDGASTSKYQKIIIYAYWYSDQLKEHEILISCWSCKDQHLTNTYEIHQHNE